MAVPSVGDRVLVTIAGVLLGQRTLNTYLYRISAITGTPDYVTLMDALHSSLSGSTQLLPTHQAAMPSNWFKSATWYQIVTPLRFRKYVKNGSGAGTALGVAYTPNVQASITRVGDVAGRKYVGGVRLPLGTDVDATDGGIVVAAQKALLQNHANAMKLNVITSGAVATFIPQVGLPKPPDTSADLFDAIPQDTTRVIRRRTVGLGI